MDPANMYGDLKWGLSIPEWNEKYEDIWWETLEKKQKLQDIRLELVKKWEKKETKSTDPIPKFNMAASNTIIKPEQIKFGSEQHQRQKKRNE